MSGVVEGLLIYIPLQSYFCLLCVSQAQKVFLLGHGELSQNWVPKEDSHRINVWYIYQTHLVDFVWLNIGKSSIGFINTTFFTYSCFRLTKMFGENSQVINQRPVSQEVPRICPRCHGVAMSMWPSGCRTGRFFQVTV